MTKGQNRACQRRQHRKALNRSTDPASKDVHGYGGCLGSSIPKPMFNVEDDA